MMVGTQQCCSFSHSDCFECRWLLCDWVSWAEITGYKCLFHTDTLGAINELTTKTTVCCRKCDILQWQFTQKEEFLWRRSLEMHLFKAIECAFDIKNDDGSEDLSVPTPDLMSASLQVIYKPSSSVKRWNIRTDNRQQWDRDSKCDVKENGKRSIRKMTERPETSKGRETKRKEKLRSAGMARLFFQYVLKRSQQQHTLKVWGRSQQNTQIKRRRTHCSEWFTLGVIRKMQWTGPMESKIAIGKTNKIHCNLTKCFSR